MFDNFNNIMKTTISASPYTEPEKKNLNNFKID